MPENSPVGPKTVGQPVAGATLKAGHGFRFHEPMMGLLHGNGLSSGEKGCILAFAPFLVLASTDRQ